MKLLFRFLALMRGQLFAATVGVLTSITASASSITLMATAGWFITAMGIAGFSGVLINIFIPSALIRLMAVFRTALRYFDRLFTHDATFKIIENIRLDLFKRAVDLKYEEVSHFKTSDLERRMRGDTDNLEKAYVRQFVPIVCAFTVGFIVGLWFAYHDAGMALALVGTMVVTGVIIPFCISMAVRKHSVAVNERSRTLNNNSSDLVFGMFDLTLMNKTDAYVSRFKQDADELAKSHAKLNLAEGINGAFMQVAAMFAYMVVTIIGIEIYRAGKLSGADLVMLGIASMAVFEVVVPLSGAFLNIANVKISAQRIFSLVDNRQQERRGQDRIEGRVTSVELRDVCFNYEGCTRNIIDHLSIEFTTDKNYLIRGHSGRGKSTLLNLISALIEPKSGSILINGIDYSRLDTGEIRRHFSTSTQDISLFSGTIRNIFTPVKPNITDDEIYALLRTVEMDEFVRHLPDGLDQFIGNTGLLLSGGQARRLCVARALCKPCDLLILDEPTEGLDSELETIVINRILNLRKGIIMISHKPAGQDLVDKIINF